MIHTTRQLDGIRDRLRAGARNVSAALVDALEPSVTEVQVTDLSCRALGTLTHEDLGGDGDRVAAVSCALHGSLSGTAVFAMEPEDAFAWVLSSGSGEDPLTSFVSSGEHILRELVRSTGESEPRPELSGAALREESLMEILIGTHAPSDTLLLSARLELCAADLRLPASLHLLVAPKQFNHLGGPIVGAG